MINSVDKSIMNPVMNNPELQETRQVQKTREAEVSKAEDSIPQDRTSISWNSVQKHSHALMRLTAQQILPKKRRHPRLPRRKP